MATPEGADVLFTSKGALTSNAHTNGDTTEDLYEYNVTEKSLTDVSSEGLADPSGSRVQGTIGMSEDASVIYFVAQGKLTSEATSGAENLYLSQSGHLSYIADLSASDASDWSGKLQARSARITPNGRHLLFSSVESLTAYSNAGHAEMYLYALGQPGFTCVSCSATGTSATSAASLGGREEPAFPPAANMSSDGSTVFFESQSALAPGATEGVGGIYEWHQGVTSLIATLGVGDEFVGASTDGSNIFFKSHESLVPEDETGGEAEIYAARVDGGFPAPPKPAKQCESNGECRSESTTLSAPTVTSLVPGAIGNSAPAASIKITNHSASSLTVSTPGAGTLSLSGDGLMVQHATATHAGSYTVALALTPPEKRELARHGKVTVQARVTFVPTSSKPSTVTAKVTIKKKVASASSKPAAKRRAGRRKGSGKRSAEALAIIQEQPGISIVELAARMKIKQKNYLYRVLPALAEEGSIRKEGRGWHPTEAAVV